ncbi:YhgE/Pip domain-containing protein [Bacillus sp. T33-2]|uniref:YhgE/Pip domain-containing protein n=1 Tax=Bacillus sp. T33-2 TaxID=2054168 RepID=UPI000C792547|nr:ABC transporter permease [Bacillus sp. T33-2]PLR98444.1 hypothetical protein CVD19_05020 [Bacillus sp. T33-2]
MQALKQYFKIPETYVGIVMAFVIPIVFFLVWLNVFKDADSRLNQLRIAVVSEDKQADVIVDQLRKNLPFQLGTLSSIEDAKEEMDQRNWDMVVYIPAAFSQALAKGNSAILEYYINQSGSSISKQAMESASQRINEQVNAQMSEQKKNKIAEQLSKNISESMPTPQIVNSVVPKVTAAIHSMDGQPVTSKVTKTNGSASFASDFLPLMLIITSYVGAMVMNLLLHMAKNKVTSNKWGTTASKLMIDIVVSLIMSLLIISMLNIFNIPTKLTFIEMWLLQSSAFFAFTVFSGVFFTFLGKMGMIVNLIILVTQLATSGVLIPRAMLTDFFYSVSDYLPATHAADGYYSILFGGGNISHNTNVLVFFSLVSITMIFLHTALIRKNKMSNEIQTQASRMTHNL